VQSTQRIAFLVGFDAFTATIGLHTPSIAQPIAVLPRKAVSERETDPSELQLLRDAVFALLEAMNKSDGANGDDRIKISAWLTT